MLPIVLMEKPYCGNSFHVKTAWHDSHAAWPPGVTVKFEVTLHISYPRTSKEQWQL